MKLLVIIPAYNEEQSIVKVVQELQKTGPYDYVILNDGSLDDTAKKSKENAFSLIDIPKNVGLKKAFHIGIQYAVENGYDTVLQFDGDGQHRPEYIKPMLKKMERGGFDVVIGSRSKKAIGDNGLRGIGNRILSMLIYKKTGKKISDTTSGMRLYGPRMLRMFYRNVNLPPEPCMLAVVSLRQFKIGEVNVQMRERRFGKSYLTFWRSMRYMIEQSLAILFVK